MRPLLCPLLLLCLAACPPPKPYDDGGGDGNPPGGDGLGPDLNGGPPVGWAVRMRADLTANIGGLAVDSAGNTYVAGHFAYRLYVGNHKHMATGNDLFLAKLDPAGKRVWSRSYGSDFTEQLGAMARDTGGNIYIAGVFTKKLVLGKDVLSSKGGFEVFVAKLDKNGQPLWARAAGGPGNDSALGVTADGQGNCVVSGQFSEQAIFGKFALKSAGGIDAFVARLDSKGNWVWAMRGGSGSIDRAQAVAVDKAGEIFVVGQYTGSLTLGPRQLHSKHGGSGHQDVFLARVGPGGGVRWLTGVDGTSYVDGRAVALDANGNPHITGSFDKLAHFGGQKQSAQGYRDIYVARFSADGKVGWVAVAGGGSNDFGASLALDATGRAVMVGSFYSSSLKVGGTSLSNRGKTDVVVAWLSAAGKWLYAYGAGGDGADSGARAAVSPDGSQFLAAGTFKSAKAKFGGTTLGLDGDQQAVFVWRH